MNEQPNKKDNLGPLVFGAILVGIGVLFLVINLVPFLSVAKLWPLFMLIPVGLMAATYFQDRKKSEGVILPVIILLFFCGYFLWLNFTSWGNVGETWPNFLIGPGLGFLGLFLVSKKWEYLIPSFILLILAAVFYAAIIENTIMVGILLIAMGAILIGRYFFSPRRDAEDQ